MSPSPRIGEREGVRGCQRGGFAICTACNEAKNRRTACAADSPHPDPLPAHGARETSTDKPGGAAQWGRGTARCFISDTVQVRQNPFSTAVQNGFWIAPAARPE